MWRQELQAHKQKDNNYELRRLRLIALRSLKTKILIKIQKKKIELTSKILGAQKHKYHWIVFHIHKHVLSAPQVEADWDRLKRHRLKFGALLKNFLRPLHTLLHYTMVQKDMVQTA